MMQPRGYMIWQEEPRLILAPLSHWLGAFGAMYKLQFLKWQSQNCYLKYVPAGLLEVLALLLESTCEILKSGWFPLLSQCRI